MSATPHDFSPFHGRQKSIPAQDVDSGGSPRLALFPSRSSQRQQRDLGPSEEQPGTSPATPSKKKSVSFDPLSWFRRIRKNPASPAVTRRNSSAAGSIRSATTNPTAAASPTKSTRRRPDMPKRASSTPSSLSTWPLKFSRTPPKLTRQGRHPSAHHSRRSSMHSIPDVSSEYLLPGGRRSSISSEGTSRRLSTLHLRVPRVRTQKGECSPAGSSNSSDSYEKAKSYWEASVGPQRPS